MPIVGKAFTASKKLFMPSTEGAKAEDQGWLVIKKDLTTDQVLAFSKFDAKAKPEDIKIFFEILSDLVMDWNYNDPKTNTKAVITPETLRNSLSFNRDIPYIVTKIQETISSALPKDEKKN